MKRKETPWTVTRAQGVRLLGISSATFSRLESEGAWAPSRRGRGQRGALYDPPALVAGFLAHRERRKDYLDLEQERAALAKSQREKCDLDNERKRKESHQAAWCDRRTVQIITASRDRLLRLEHDARVPEDAKAAVLEAIAETLEELASLEETS